MLYLSTYENNNNNNKLQNYFSTYENNKNQNKIQLTNFYILNDKIK